MLKIKGFKQSDTSRCGPASIKMVLDYYGIKASEDEVSKRCNHSFELGCTNEDAVKAFKTYGLKAEIKQNCTIKQLKTFLKKDIPPIVDWFTCGVAPTEAAPANGHYSIVVDVDDKYVHLLDPEDGDVRKLLIPEFERVWFDWSKDKILTPKSKMFYQTIIIAYKNRA